MIAFTMIFSLRSIPPEDLIVFQFKQHLFFSICSTAVGHWHLNSLVENKEAKPFVSPRGNFQGLCKCSFCVRFYSPKKGV